MNERAAGTRHRPWQGLVGAGRAFRRTRIGGQIRATPAVGAALSVLRRHGDGAGWIAAVRALRESHRTRLRLAELPARQVVDLAYETVLQRLPDPEDVEHYLPLLVDGLISPHGLVERLTLSPEWRFGVHMTRLAPSLHMSRCEFVQLLPVAARILDLGGTALGLREGALVTMGYPYRFEELVIVDLPPDDREATYRDGGARHDVVESPMGTVRYRYHSMADLSDFGDETFDLVYSGQSIEHISVVSVSRLLSEVFRVLRPGGHFALDTPNARVTRLQQDDYIDPDHDYEYTAAEMRVKLEAAGFEVAQEYGLNYAGESCERGQFSEEEVATRRGVFADIENCYLLAYICQKPLIRSDHEGSA